MRQKTQKISQQIQDLSSNNFKWEDLKNICYQSRLGQEGRQEQITEETSYVLLKFRAERKSFC